MVFRLAHSTALLRRTDFNISFLKTISYDQEPVSHIHITHGS